MRDIHYYYTNRSTARRSFFVFTGSRSRCTQAAPNLHGSFAHVFTFSTRTSSQIKFTTVRYSASPSAKKQESRSGGLCACVCACAHTVNNRNCLVPQSKPVHNNIQNTIATSQECKSNIIDWRVVCICACGREANNRNFPGPQSKKYATTHKNNSWGKQERNCRYFVQIYLNYHSGHMGIAFYTRIQITKR